MSDAFGVVQLLMAVELIGFSSETHRSRRACELLVSLGD